MSFRRRLFPDFEVAHIDGTGLAFEKHTHDEFVIGVNIQGEEHVWLDGHEMDVGPAHVTLYNPGEVQAGTVQGGPWRFVSFYVPPAVLPALIGLPAHVVFARPILGDAVLATTVRALADDALAGVLDEGEIGERMVSVLAGLFRVAGARPSRIGRASPPVARVAERLRDSLEQTPSLQALAADEGLSAVQLVRAFRRAHGLPPLAWLFQQRLHEARRRLTRGERPALVAADLGFADQAHLTRRFKAAFGVTPARWAKGGD
ncbi:AraC family transcriptional regulator [Pararhodospirillum oryzae]|uniref:Transcriptional regulator n=1 Tax=Pararhodospirillum oryzae TaxID=478448 RepID=A0A512H9E0_9PROT|nr:AraC family transcriptional regulator [Pararhodospirillum oryzae]GEO82076.1 transcriptional regulator [Pararhodospirillum oryzae]